MSIHFLTRYRNPLAYPAGYAPGFDPNHVAARMCRFSAISTGGGAINLMNGQVGVAVNSGYGFRQGLGPTTVPTSTTSRSTFSPFPIAVDTINTVAAIGTLVTPSGEKYLICTGGLSDGRGIKFGANGVNFTYTKPGAVEIDSTLDWSAGVPYFIAASNDASNIYFVQLNLATGELKTTVVANATTPGVMDGSYIFGNGHSGSGHAMDHTAAVMYTAAFTSHRELIQWASDPWSFWYPNPGDNWTAAAAAGGSFPWWSVQNNNFVIGTGVQ
jgi:hypothetical protein